MQTNPLLSSLSMLVESLEAPAINISLRKVANHCVASPRNASALVKLVTVVLTFSVMDKLVAWAKNLSKDNMFLLEVGRKSLSDAMTSSVLVTNSLEDAWDIPTAFRESFQ